MRVVTDGVGVAVSTARVGCAPVAIGLLVSFTIASVGTEAWVDTGDASRSLKLTAAGAKAGEEVVSGDDEIRVAATGIAVPNPEDADWVGVVSTEARCTEIWLTLVTIGDEIGADAVSGEDERI